MSGLLEAHPVLNKDTVDLIKRCQEQLDEQTFKDLDLHIRQVNDYWQRCFIILRDNLGKINIEEYNYGIILPENN